MSSLAYHLYKTNFLTITEFYMLHIPIAVDVRGGDEDHLHLPHEVQRLPHGHPGLHVSGRSESSTTVGIGDSEVTKIIYKLLQQLLLLKKVANPCL